jgi:hypothetical protein
VAPVPLLVPPWAPPVPAFSGADEEHEQLSISASPAATGNRCRRSSRTRDFFIGWLGYAIKSESGPISPPVPKV